MKDALTFLALWIAADIPLALLVGRWLRASAAGDLEAGASSDRVHGRFL